TTLAPFHSQAPGLPRRVAFCLGRSYAAELDRSDVLNRCRWNRSARRSRRSRKPTSPDPGSSSNWRVTCLIICEVITITVNSIGEAVMNITKNDVKRSIDRAATNLKAATDALAAKGDQATEKAKELGRAAGDQ